MLTQPRVRGQPRPQPGGSRGRRSGRRPAARGPSGREPTGRGPSGRARGSPARGTPSPEPAAQFHAPRSVLGQVRAAESRRGGPQKRRRRIARYPGGGGGHGSARAWQRRPGPRGRAAGPPGSGRCPHGSRRSRAAPRRQSAACADRRGRCRRHEGNGRSWRRRPAARGSTAACTASTVKSPRPAPWASSHRRSRSPRPPRPG